MRSIFRDFSGDFFPVLTYPREKWPDFWVEYKRKHPRTLEEYSRKHSLSPDEEIEKLMSHSRKTFDSLYLAWVKDIRRLKSAVLEEIGQLREQLEIEREDFVIHLVCSLGIDETMFIRTDKGHVVMIDPVYIWKNSDLEELPRIIGNATIEFRKYSEVLVTGEIGSEAKARRLNVLLEQIREVVTRDSSGQLLSEIVWLLDHYVDYYHWTGFYLSGKSETLHLDAYVGEPTEHTTIPFGSGICGQAANTKKTFLVPDVSTESNYLSCSPKTKSEIVLPIIHHDEVLGELDIDSHNTDAFDELDESFLSSVCELVVPAVLARLSAADY